MPSAWTYGFFDSPNHPNPELELERLAQIHSERSADEMVELRLPARDDAPGKGSRRGDLFLFFVRTAEGPRIRGRAVVGGPARRGEARPWMIDLYPNNEPTRLWLPFRSLEVHPARELASLGLEPEDLPDPRGQAYIKRLRDPGRLDTDDWWLRADPPQPTDTGTPR